jgi:hypothetical protein
MNHTSGITKRVTELDFSVLSVKTFQIEDFSTEPAITSESTTGREESVEIRARVRALTLRILKMMRLILDSNDNRSYDLIKPWTFALRGHYTNLELKKELLEEFFKLLFSADPQITDLLPKSVIHYRLGDLLSLQNKNPIGPERIEAILSKNIPNQGIPIVLTDSTNWDYLGFINRSQLLGRIAPQNLDPLITLKLCINAENFIGTTAKISLWAAIFRQFCFQKSSFLPKELQWASEIGLKAIWY